MDRLHLQQLLNKYVDGTASEQEVVFLEAYYAKVEEQNMPDALDVTLMAKHRELIIQEIKKNIDNNEADLPAIPVHRVHFLKRTWWKYAAAVILLIGAGTYVYVSNQKEKPSVTQTNPVPVQNDVAPGGNRATLILADGRKIVLDTAANGALADQGTSSIIKNGSQILYKKNIIPSENKISYNTMSTPRGGQYQLILPDGSQVWLNAESSITYPTAFSEKERKVSIIGEVYFEVAKNKAKPFIVSVAGGRLRHPEPSAQREREGSAEITLEIEVLGTHFNVNAYKDEDAINTTLLEGSVRLTVHASRLTTSVLTLTPQQQGQLKDQGLSLAVNPDIDQVMAWKNGTFYFQSEDIRSIMKQLARWYDLEVEYTGNIPQRTFTGEIDRNLTLIQVLNVLTQTRIKYRIQGNKITILP